MRGGSFDGAAESLADEAEITVSGRQVGRIAHGLGAELEDDRDQRVEEFQNKQATPEVSVVPRLAVVEVDGGRLQTRSEARNPAKVPASTTPRGARTRSPTCSR